MLDNAIYFFFYLQWVLFKNSIHLQPQILVKLRANDKLKDDRQSFVKPKSWR